MIGSKFSDAAGLYTWLCLAQLTEFPNPGCSTRGLGAQPRREANVRVIGIHQVLIILSPVELSARVSHQTWLLVPHPYFQINQWDQTSRTDAVLTHQEYKM